MEQAKWKTEAKSAAMSQTKASIENKSAVGRMLSESAKAVNVAQELHRMGHRTVILREDAKGNLIREPRFGQAIC